MAIPLLINPRSGGGRGAWMGRAVATRLRRQGWNVHEEALPDAEELGRRVEEWCESGTPVVMVCGGDGTIHRTLPALAHRETALGVIPAGRGNDLAQALGIPRTAAGCARFLGQALKQGGIRTIDLGQVGNTPFVTAATCGLDSRVAEWASQPGRRVRPSWVYLIGTLRLLAQDRPRWIRLESDRGVWEGQARLCPILNVPRYGGRFLLAPCARMDDGLLDFCFVSWLPVGPTAALIPRALRGRHRNHPAVVTGQGRRFLVHSDPTEAIYADGELVARTPTQIEVLPEALRVLVPVAKSPV